MEHEFGESDKSLKHELGSILRFCLSHVSCLRRGSILVFYTRGGWVAGLRLFTLMTNIFQGSQWKHLRKLKWGIALNAIRILFGYTVMCGNILIITCVLIQINLFKPQTPVKFGQLSRITIFQDIVKTNGTTCR